MTLVVKGTARRADPFVRSFRRAVTVGEIPDWFDDLSRAQKSAKLLCLRSQYGHMELITEGRTLPVLLQRAAFRHVARPRVDPPLANPTAPAPPSPVSPSSSVSPSPSSSPSSSPSVADPPDTPVRE
jgi:hypothetical protein